MVDGEEGMSMATRGMSTARLGKLWWCSGKIMGGVRSRWVQGIGKEWRGELGFVAMAELGALQCFSAKMRSVNYGGASEDWGGCSRMRERTVELLRWPVCFGVARRGKERRGREA